MAWTSPLCSARSDSWKGRSGGDVLVEDVRRGLGVGALDLDLHVQPARPQDGRIDHVFAVRGADHDHVVEPFDAVDLAEQLRDDGRLDVGGDAGAAGAEQRIHFVEEHHDGAALGGLFPGAGEDQPDVPFGLADVLVEELRALDVQEVALHVRLAGALGGPGGQRVGHGLGDQRLAAARRAVEQDALGRLQPVFAVQVRVQERQFDGVADLFDLRAEAADVLVGDVRDFLEDEVLHLGARDFLQRVAGARIDRQGVADPELLREQGAGEPDDPLLVGAAHHQGTVRPQHFLERDEVAGPLVAEPGNHHAGPR